MLEATRMPTFATVVGVAPSTTTMQLGAAPKMHAMTVERHDPLSMRGVRAMQVRADGVPTAPTAPKKKLPPKKPPHQRRRYYVPYASFEDLRSPGFGIVNESDAWMTGRPYGLPGTSVIRLDQQHGGYHSPDGYHYNASMVGGGFGDADATLQLILVQQQAQAASLKRIAFWQAVAGGFAIASVVATVAVGITAARRRR